MSSDYDIDDRVLDVARALIDVYERRNLTTVHEHYTAYRMAVELVEESDTEEARYAEREAKQREKVANTEWWQLSVGKHIIVCRNCRTSHFEQLDDDSFKCGGCSTVVQSNPLVNIRRISV